MTPSRSPSTEPQRAAVIEPSRIFIRHGENRRNFIGPHAIELPNGNLHVPGGDRADTGVPEPKKTLPAV